MVAKALNLTCAKLFGLSDQKSSVLLIGESPSWQVYELIPPGV